MIPTSESLNSLGDAWPACHPIESEAGNNKRMTPASAFTARSILIICLDPTAATPKEPEVVFHTVIITSAEKYELRLRHIPPEEATPAVIGQNGYTIRHTREGYELVPPVGPLGM